MVAIFAVPSIATSSAGTLILCIPPDREAFEKLGAHVDKCTSVVGKAAGWATELILEEMSERHLHLDDLQKILSSDT
jgi:hypothetical protein